MSDVFEPWNIDLSCQFSLTPWAIEMDLLEASHGTPQETFLINSTMVSPQSIPMTLTISQGLGRCWCPKKSLLGLLLVVIVSFPASTSPTCGEPQVKPWATDFGHVSEPPILCSLQVAQWLAFNPLCAIPGPQMTRRLREAQGFSFHS